MSPIFLLLLGLTLVTAAPNRENLLPRVVDAVHRAIKFFSSDYSSVNVDGLFGLRLGQGQILEALKECEERSCPENLVQNLTQFVEELDVIGRKAMPYIEESGPDYFERFYDTIATPYILEYQPHFFRNMGEVQVGLKVDYNEEQGDRCYARVLGTYKEGGRPLPRCNITQSCLDLMTEDNTEQYVITHQLLYFIVIEHTGCKEKLSQEVSSLNLQGIREIEDRLCKKIFKEASQLASGYRVEIGYQDLFFEQSVLCGSLGYENFMDARYIDMVLKMQAHEGCFKLSPDLVPEEQIESLGSRKLLREQTMKHGCLSHKSGLGFGTLGVYLRYLIRNLQ